jgi:Ca-activated chloride channel homolog
VLQNRALPMAASIGFASAVAEFGMLLRESKHRGNATYESVTSRARQFKGDDTEGYRTEFIRLVELAADLRRVEHTALRN